MSSLGDLCVSMAIKLLYAEGEDFAHFVVCMLYSGSLLTTREQMSLYQEQMTWQNQQYECSPSEDPDQPGHPPSLIRVFAVRSIGS